MLEVDKVAVKIEDEDECDDINNNSDRKSVSPNRSTGGRSSFGTVSETDTSWLEDFELKLSDDEKSACEESSVLADVSGNGGESSANTSKSDPEFSKPIIKRESLDTSFTKSNKRRRSKNIVDTKQKILTDYYAIKTVPSQIANGSPKKQLVNLQKLVEQLSFCHVVVERLPASIVAAKMTKEPVLNEIIDETCKLYCRKCKILKENIHIVIGNPSQRRQRCNVCDQYCVFSCQKCKFISFEFYSYFVRHAKICGGSDGAGRKGRRRKGTL